LTADGADFVPVRATIVDNKGVPKVLALEFVSFEVEGPATIIGGAFNQGNPVKTEYGTASALVRATTTPGVIKVKAHAKGLVSGEVSLVSASPALPLGFDARYAAESKPPNGSPILIQVSRPPGVPGGVTQLREELLRLQRELTSKEQDLMELRTKAGK
jgi:beta-galactosidase